MVILCDYQNIYCNHYDDTKEAIEEIINMIEDSGFKYYYDKIYNIIKVISQEQYEMYKQKKELHAFFNEEEIYSSTENIMVENNEIDDTAKPEIEDIQEILFKDNDILQVKKCEKPEKLSKKELNKIYRDTHKEYFKKYVNENKQHIKELKSNFYDKNKEKLKEKAKVYRETHKEELKIKRKEYKERNKEKIKIYNKKYFDSKKQEKIKELEDIEKKKNKRKEYHKQYYENRKKIKQENN